MVRLAILEQPAARQTEHNLAGSSRRTPCVVKVVESASSLYARGLVEFRT